MNIRMLEEKNDKSEYTRNISYRIIKSKEDLKVNWTSESIFLLALKHLHNAYSSINHKNEEIKLFKLCWYDNEDTNICDGFWSSLIGVASLGGSFKIDIDNVYNIL